VAPKRLAQRLGSPLLRLAALFTDAAVATGFDDEAAALAPLKTGLALAREIGVHHIPGLQPALLARCARSRCAMALAVEQTRSLITAGRFAPPPAALRLRQWPWAFHVTDSGGFALQRGGEVIEFLGQRPGPSVELLKVLVSLGGQNVRVDVLGRRAVAACRCRLRPQVVHGHACIGLRRIFGDEDTLRLRDGALSLNGALFWLDSWALDHLLAELDRPPARRRRPYRRQRAACAGDETLACTRPFPARRSRAAGLHRASRTAARAVAACTDARRPAMEEGGPQ